MLTRTDATHWTITLTGKEGAQIEYKYALGSWDYVEKDGACGEIANRQLTLAYGADGYAGRERHGPQLAQRGSLRELSRRSWGAAEAAPHAHPVRLEARADIVEEAYPVAAERGSSPWMTFEEHFIGLPT